MTGASSVGNNPNDSVFCGAIIGLERQLKGKPVGVRTSSLITLGTYLFLSTAYLLQGQIVDPSRVVGQVITGIGFLGAGVMLAKEGAVVGTQDLLDIVRGVSGYHGPGPVLNLAGPPRMRHFERGVGPQE